MKRSCQRQRQIFELAVVDIIAFVPMPLALKAQCERAIRSLAERATEIPACLRQISKLRP